MGIFGRNIEAAYGSMTDVAVLPPAILSPWGPQDALVTWALDDALKGLIEGKDAPLTREIALRVPGVKRAHGIACSMFARVPFHVMDNDRRATDQPAWLMTSTSGVSPYHRQYGIASDWFFYGWALLGFTDDMSDCLHIPYGLWECDQDGRITVKSDKIDARFTAKLILLPLGYGENGLLVDGADTIKQSRKIEAAYQDRLENPVPLTILNIPWDIWSGWTGEERRQYRDQWNEGRKNGATATKPAEWGVDMPGQTSVDLYESGRNAARLDIANHTAMPAGLLEGLRQGGGGGTEIRYSSDVGGAHRSELWDFGLPGRFVYAFEGRMSLDDVVASGLSIRGDLTAEFSAPNQPIDPTSED